MVGHINIILFLYYGNNEKEIILLIIILLNNNNNTNLTIRILCKKFKFDMLRVILNKSWRQHPTKQQLYGHLPSITKTIQVRRTRHAGQCWKSRVELISDVPIWAPLHGRATAGQPARTYIQQLCEDTGCSPGDLLEPMNDKEGGVRGSGISLLMSRQDDDEMTIRTYGICKTQNPF